MNKFPVSLLRQLLNCMQDGLSIRVTAQKLGIPKSSVSFLSQTVLSHGGGAKEAELIQLPDTQLLETFYPPTTKVYQEPDWVEVHKKLARRNVTLKLLYDAYKSQVVRRAYTYTSFCGRYAEWRQGLVMDKAKALVKHSSWYGGEVQQTVRSLCNHYDIEPWVCQPRRPKQKNRVEAGVGLAQRRIIAAMELERTPMACDLDYLNEQVKAKLEEINNAPFTATERSNSRRQMFKEEKREYLGRLPLQASCPLDIRVLVVDRGHCARISGDGHRYSTPPECTGKRVAVTITDDKVLHL